MRKKDFTLIELLIVVLIIAILAAIAVPNFLEFQVRAKISRSLSDMRNVSVAIEAYMIDEGSYPIASDGPGSGDAPPTYPTGDFVTINTHLGTSGLNPVTEYAHRYTFALRTNSQNISMITTPISYISSIPYDPLVKASQIVAYGYYRTPEHSGAYLIWGFGPNPIQNDNGSFQYSQGALTPIPRRVIKDAEISWDLYVSTWNGNLDARALTYDPTNGTISDGDLWRFGPGGSTSGQR